MNRFKRRVLVAAFAFLVAAALSSLRGRGPATPSGDFQATPPISTFKCGTKHYCREMTSCDEARFFLKQCGVTTIDGDHDGVPCEQALCR